MKLKGLLLLLLTFAFATTEAQEYNYRHYTTKNGLPSMVVYDVLQDHKGFIWIATMEGVARFDGYTFKVFTTDHGLPSNEVLGLWLDQNDRIWMLCFRKGIAYFENDSIKPYSFSIAPEDLPLKGFVPDTLGNFWLTTASGDVVCYRDKVVKRLYKKQLVKYFNSQIELMPDQKGGVWLGSEASLFHWQDSVKQIASVPIAKELVSPTKPLISNNGQIYLHTNSVVWVYENGQLTEILNTGDTINIMRGAATKDGGILLSTSSGAVFINYCTSTNLSVEWFLKDKSIGRVIEDQEGNHWYASLNSGLYMLTASSRQIANLGPKDIFFKKLPGSITLIDSTVVVSSNFGDVYAVKQSGHYYLEHLKTNNLYSNFGNCMPLAGAGLWCKSGVGIIRLKQNAIANLDSITYIERTINDVEGQYPESVNCINIGTIKAVATIGDSIIIAASNIGLYTINTRLTHKHYKVTQLLAEHITAVAYQAQNKVLWVATKNGLFYWPVTQPFELKPDTSLKLLAAATINSLGVGSQGELLIGTSGAGLYVKSKHSLQHFSTYNGLPATIVNHITCLPQTHLIATTKGLSMLYHAARGDSFEIMALQINDGLIGENIKQTFVFNGNVYILSTNGLSIVSQKLLQADNYAPRVHFLRIAFDNADTAIAPSYTLPYYANNVKLEYVGLLYKADGNLQYRYQMEGIDTGWATTPFTNVQYPALPPGKYTFKVDARSLQGPWSGKPATVAITILPPFWQTWWFRLLVGALLAALVVGISYAIVRYYRNQSNIAQRMVALEGQALRAQMNPHFIFNALNAIHDFIANSDERSAHLYLGKFAQLIRKILEQSRKQEIGIQEEIDTLKLYLELEKLRFPGRFEYHILCDESLYGLDAALPPMLVQPYVENAIRHGLMNANKKGVLTIRFEQKESTMRVTIEDNGVGREKAEAIASLRLKHHRSLAMEITKQRIALQKEDDGPNGIVIDDLTDQTGQPSGTRVTFWVPLAIEETHSL